MKLIVPFMNDPCTLGLEQLSKTKTVYMTIVGGRIIHQQS